MTSSPFLRRRNWFCGILRTIVGGQAWLSVPSDRARAPSGERRTDGADVTMRWDLRRRNWFCGMPRSFRTTQTCLSEHLDRQQMPTGGGSLRSGRGDVLIVGTCFSHISSLPRGSYKFISTRRCPVPLTVRGTQDPQNHFYFNDIKFASLDVVKKLKQKRMEKKM